MPPDQVRGRLFKPGMTSLAQIPQHPVLPPTCMGGHGTVPKEQKTQQSPGFGRRTVWHCSHS